MKKTRYFIIGLLIALCSCKPDALNDPDRPSIINPGDIFADENETLEPDTQKEKLEQVATKMIDLFPAEEYDDIMDMCAEAVGYGESIFDEDYDWSELEDAWEDISGSFFDQEEISEYETRYFLYLFLSNCTGTVEFKKNRARYTQSSDTKVIFYTDEGDKWVAVIEPKGLKEVYLGEWMDEYYDYYYDQWYTEYYNVTVEVPSSLTATLDRNGKNIAKVSFSIDHNIGKDGVDLEKNSISFSCEIIIDDLKYTVGNLMYNAKNGEGEFTSSLYKGDIFVFSESFSGNASYELDEEGYIEDWSGKKVSFRYNLLGEIQISGTCKDIKRFSELADSDIDSENDLERTVNNLNSLLDIDVYYDCTSTRQASIELEPMVDEDYYYGDYYWIEPVIVFEDGSRYLFYEYFEEDDFEYLIKKFERMVEDYEDLFEDIY